MPCVVDDDSPAQDTTLWIFRDRPRTERVVPIIGTTQFEEF